METLYAHQQRFKEANPDKALLCWETGTGKTVAGCLWLRKRTNALVICPKTVTKKWERDLKKWGARADIISTDQIKKIKLDKYKAIIVDECQNFSSPLFEKSRSQRASILYEHIRNNPETNILLLTASVVRSTPFNVHTLACYLGIFWDVKRFKNKFFHMTNKYGRFHYEKKRGWQKAIRPYVEEISDIVLMQDCIDVPKQHHQIIKIDWDEEEFTNRYLEPIVEWHERHRAENSKKKFNELEKIINGYQKIIVVCYYRRQIDEYVKYIGEDRQVFILHGGVKDQDKVIQEAREAQDCVFFVQAQMGVGFDAAEFSVVVFASMSFMYVAFQQMCGRVKRINNLHENTFIYLLGGECDEAVYKTIQSGKDFDPIAYLASEKSKTRSKYNPKGASLVQGKF